MDHVASKAKRQNKVHHDLEGRELGLEEVEADPAVDHTPH
jgi:hypothetical protein